MKTLQSCGLRYEIHSSTGKWQIKVLDQTLLPHREEWIVCETSEQMITIIQKLKVRGAPLIGVAASLMLGHLASEGLKNQALINTANALIQARPTAVNLQYGIERLLSSHQDQGPEALLPEAIAFFEEDQKLCERIGQHGATLIDHGDHILTHCNAGALATAGIGTAIGVITTAHKQNKNIHVFADETRPLLQGARLTAWEMAQENVPCTLICDNMAASLMAEKRIQKIIVGADRIAANGDTANKIGTYNLAVLAHYHKIPFYVAAPYSTVDLNCPNGSAIPIEQRSANEVLGYGDTLWGEPNTAIYNPAFDVTPAELVTAWILDSGIAKSAEEFPRDSA